MPRLVKIAKSGIAQRMLRAEEYRDKANEFSKKANEHLKEIENFMLEKKVDEYITDDGQDKVLSALVYKKEGRITYDFGKMQEKLPKEKLKQVTNSMLVADEAGLSAFIKSHPELRDELKLFVHKVTVIDENKLAMALDYGVVTHEDIEDCYTQGKETTIFKLQRKKREENQ